MEVNHRCILWSDGEGRKLELFTIRTQYRGDNQRVADGVVPQLRFTMPVGLNGPVREIDFIVFRRRPLWHVQATHRQFRNLSQTNDRRKQVR